MFSMSQEEFREHIELAAKMVQHHHNADNFSSYGRKAENELKELEICTKCQLEQLERFGIDNWKGKFIRLNACIPETFDENYKCDPELGEDDRNKLMRKLLETIPSALKQFQECFSENEEFIIRVNPYQFDRSDLFATFVSPRCIPDKLVSDLHLCDFSDCKRNPVRRMELKADPEVIDALKLVFSTLVNNNGTFDREYILPEIHSINPAIEKKLAEYNKYCVGQILVFSESIPQEAHLISNIKGSGVSFDRTKILIYKNADARIRAGLHLQNSYQDEFDKLTSHISRLDEIVSLLSHWKRETPQKLKDDIQNEFLLTVEEIRKGLELVSNPFKTSALHDLDKIVLRLSSNKQASLLVIDKAKRLLQKRFGESSIIRSAKSISLDSIIYDVNMAKHLLGRFENCFNEYLAVQKEGLACKNDLQFVLLDSVVNELGEINVTPYNIFAKAIQKTFAEYKNFVNLPNAKPADFNLEKKINMYLQLYHIRQHLCEALTPNLSIDTLKVHLKDASISLIDFMNDYNSELSEETKKFYLALNKELFLLQGIRVVPSEEYKTKSGDKKIRINDYVREELKSVLGNYDIPEMIREEILNK